MAGGIIDRYARDRPTRAIGFFAASGVFFFRFLRLAVVQWLVYPRCSAALHPWLFDRFYPRLTHDINGGADGVRNSRRLVPRLRRCWWPPCNMVFDYAKVRAVVEDRRSMLGAIVAAVRFHRGATPAPRSPCFLAELRALRGGGWRLYALVAPGGRRQRAGRCGWRS